MQTMVERGCGLDVAEASVVACLLIGPANRRVRKVIQTFGTFLRDLEALRDWLIAEGITHVAMESTGPYWVPIYAVLEKAGCFELVLGNAQHIRNVPGRKTDIRDAEWIADLLRHGLIRKSFVPPKPLRELRELLRARRALVHTKVSERNRLLKLLEMANIKIAQVVSDVFGVSGRLMLDALLEGKATVEQMAHLARGRLRHKHEALMLGLQGHLEDHHRLLLRIQLRRIDEVERDIAALHTEIDLRLEPYRKQHRLLMGIPGVDWVIAAVIIAEIGIDMTVFPSHRHLAAWSGVCPGNYQSGRKAKKGPVRKGNVYLKTALVQAAQGASRTKGTYLKSKYHRLRSRRGPRAAGVAVAHKIIVAVYYVLATGLHYRDLGENYLDRLAPRRTAGRLLNQLKRMGYNVQVVETTA
jgi:transposase